MAPLSTFGTVQPVKSRKQFFVFLLAFAGGEGSCTQQKALLQRKALFLAPMSARVSVARELGIDPADTSYAPPGTFDNPSSPTLFLGLSAAVTQGLTMETSWGFDKLKEQSTPFQSSPLCSQRGRQ